jgi:hypothetical protein
MMRVIGIHVRSRSKEGDDHAPKQYHSLYGDTSIYEI